MKRLFATLLGVLFTATVLGQAKKPTVMVVPSDRWCIANGFVAGTDETGRQIPDYQKALQSNSDVRVLISTMSGIMASRDFPFKSLEAELKVMANDQALMNAQAMDQGYARMIQESNVDKLLRSAAADIIIDLDFTIVKGMRQQVSFNVQALDAYTSKIISGNTGNSSASSAPIESLLRESVGSFIDQFSSDLQRHFDSMFADGREIRVVMQRWSDSDVDFETYFDYNGVEAELADIIEVWMADSTVEGRFSTDQRSANVLRFSQVRIPLYGKNIAGREVAIDASGWLRSLSTELRKSNYGNIPTQIIPKGLGEVWLILGDK